MGHFTEALEFIQQAEKEPGEEKLERLNIKALEAAIIARRTGYSTVAGIVRELSRSYLELGRRKDYAYSILSAIEYEMAIRKPPDFFRVIKEASEVLDEVGELPGQEYIHNLTAAYYFNRGDVALGAENYAAAANLYKKMGLYSAILWNTWYWTMLYENGGLYDDAIRVALDGLEAAAMAEAPYPESGVYATLARCYLRTNKVDDARRALGRMNELYEKHSKDASAALQGLVARAQALEMELEGRGEEADRRYATAIDLLKRFGMSIHEAEARREYGELLLKQKRWEEAKSQLEAAIVLYEGIENTHGAESARNALKATR